MTSRISLYSLDSQTGWSVFTCLSKQGNQVSRNRSTYLLSWCLYFPLLRQVVHSVLELLYFICRVADTHRYSPEVENNGQKTCWGLLSLLLVAVPPFGIRVLHKEDHHARLGTTSQCNQCSWLKLGKTAGAISRLST